MVYDRPQWKAFVCGLPTLEPEQVRQVASMVILDSKSIAHAMGCACRKLSRDVSEYDLIQCIRAYSLAPVRVTSSVCLHGQGSRLHVIVR